MGEFGHWDDGVKMPPCMTCAAEEANHGSTFPSLPADMICMVKKTDGGEMGMPLCSSHAQIGLIAPALLPTPPEAKTP